MTRSIILGFLSFGTTVLILISQAPVGTAG
jgi:hypothetical protein